MKIKEKEENKLFLRQEIAELDSQMDCKAGQYAGMIGHYSELDNQFYRGIFGFDDFFRMQELEKKVKAKEVELREVPRTQRAGKYFTVLADIVQILEQLLQLKKQLLATLVSKIAGQ